ncbi:MAG: DNA adenine methylase [Acidimicrobiia bacterium]
MIKYIGSKRRLVPVLGRLLSAVEAETALDLFTGTTRVAQEFKRRGAEVWAVDTARYSEIFGQCYIATDRSEVDHDDLEAALTSLNALAGYRGYFTETFCERSRYFMPENGRRVDQIRDVLSDEFAGSPLFPILMTSLLEAADRVDSTTGLQMAYLKTWAPRASNPLELRVPDLIAGPGHAVRADATRVVDELPRVDVAYLDPPYNQHRYFTNYHVWETLVGWDAPQHYGVACKRIDARDDSTKSVFNSKHLMKEALASTISRVDANFLMVSFNNEGWITIDELVEMCAPGRECVEVLSFDSKRYVGAQIGIYNPSGDRVGEVSHLRNLEFVVLAGDRERVEAAASLD